jgi:hypothetical protein
MLYARLRPPPNAALVASKDFKNQKDDWNVQSALCI